MYELHTFPPLFTTPNDFLNPNDYWTFKDITAQVVSIVETRNHGISVFFF